MNWKTTLNELLEVLFPLSSAIAAMPQLTAEAAWHSPVLLVLREKLMADLTSPARRAALLDVAAELRAQLAVLRSKEPGEAKDRDLLTVLSAADQVLAAESLGGEPKEVFIHALTRILPWLRAAGEAALIESPLLPRSAGGSAGSDGGRFIHPCGDLVSRDVNSAM